MSIELFHQRLRELSTKTILGSKPNSTLAMFEHAFVVIEPTSDIPEIAMIRAIWVDLPQRGKGVGAKILSMLIELAEEFGICLGAWIKPFVILRSSGNIENAAKGFIAQSIASPIDPVGEISARMRRLLRRNGFQFGFDSHKLCDSSPVADLSRLVKARLLATGHSRLGLKSLLSKSLSSPKFNVDQAENATLA